MANPNVKFKRSSVPGKIPNETQVPLGEIALNTYDGKVFASKNVGIGTTVFVVNPWNVGAGTDVYNIDFAAGNVGIGSTLPTSKLSVVGSANFTGIVTASGGFNLGISSAGTSITSGPLTTLNFVGAGNTFAINGTTVDISISGGGGSVSIGTAAPATPTAGALWYNSNLGRIFIYYNDGSSSQWVDAAPFNLGILQSVSGIAFTTGSAVFPSWYFTNDIQTGVFSPSSGQLTVVSSGSSVLNINRAGINVTGISTLGNTIVGGATTQLVVNGDARVTGILTIGTSSVTLDGTNNQVNVGSGVTIHHTNGVQVGPNTLHSTGLSVNQINASGIITASSFSGSGANLTTLNASNITSGTVPATRITSTNALTVGGDLFVTGNISFGGTTTQLNTSQVTFSDPDLVLGIGTTSTVEPTDNTANHGGIAIASTEGSPLVNLNISPLEVLPTTYKKFMWFKNNAAGLGTDAWLSNFAVGIGSTQFPTGTRLVAGNVQFDANDAKVIRHINASGIVTASSFSGSGANLTTLNASNISSGTVPTARLASGTADSTTYLRGDSTWATVTSGITITNDTSTNSTFYPLFTSATSGSVSTQNVSSTKLTYNPSTGTLAATSFSGNATTASSTPYWYNTSVGVNEIKSGNADNASFTQYNMVIRSWWGIGFRDYTDSSTVKLYIDCRTGNLASSGTISAVDINSTSDLKLKTNIKTLTNSLEKVLSMRGVEFERIDNPGKQHVGVIAQEVEAIVPELVSQDNDGTKTVAYGNITALLIEAIKEQQQQINELKLEIKELKGQ